MRVIWKATGFAIGMGVSLAFADEIWVSNEKDDTISVTGLAELAPGREVTVVLHHADGGEERIQTRHSLNKEQIGWFRAGSALNVLKTQTD